MCTFLKQKSEISTQELAQLISTMVSNFQAVKYGPLHYRNLEREKSSALRLNKGNYLGTVVLSPNSIADIDWWIANIDSA